MTTPSKPLRNLNRRRFLQSSAAVTAGLAAPAIVSRQALASSGEINIMMWSDYLPPSFVEAFEGSTGIKINFTGIGSNEEIINKLKATGGEGFDIVSPTVNRNLLWAELGLLQPFDMSKIAIEKVNPAMALGDAHWNFDGKGSHWVPHIWGTEGVAWRTDLFTPAGELEPGSMWAAYTTPEKMTEVWTKVVDHAIAKKGNIKLIWNDADTQKNGLLNEGVIVGQTWDGPPIALKTAGEPVMYRAPVEGAMAWVDGMALPTGAKNIEQVYAFIDACYNPEWAGTAIQTHGYNSPVLGADAFGGEIYAQNFADAYPGEALTNLNAWPAEGPWYSEMRTEFTNKFLSA